MTAMEKTPILVGITGASGTPLAVECLRQLRKHPEYEIHLILTQSARLALSQETTLTVAEFEAMADVVHDNDSRGDAPASGTFRSAGMLIVPCSMKTAAGICAGYADSLLLRAADVTIKEKRPLVLAARRPPQPHPSAQSRGACAAAKCVDRPADALVLRPSRHGGGYDPAGSRQASELLRH